MKIIGLTGGIASGKSTVSQVFKENKIPVICADSLAHSVILKGKKAYNLILDHFGSDILDASQEIDRKKLGPLVFQNPEALKNLNKIVHPQVFKEMDRLITIYQAEGHPFIILDVPLLFEGQTHERCDKTILVYAPENLMIKRIQNRDGLSIEEIEDRLEAQMSIEEKKNLADYIIDNSGHLEDTVRQVLKLIKKLRG